MACPHCGGEHPGEAKHCPTTGQAIAGARPAFAPGELLEGKYQITRELGRGAMGVVYEALHVSLGRRVAIKTLIEGMGADTEMGERFQREARAASAIGNSHIVDVFDLGRTHDGLLFMVMELLDGRPLAAMLKQTPKLPVPLAINLMTQVLSGLSAAHKNGIVHRDLKPDNIFVLDSEERPNFVKIVDFGISKVLDPKTAGKTAQGRFTSTMVGTVLGTPLYMSPEQAVGQVTATDHRTDIYSAGVVLYEMLCGQTPFSGATYPEVLGKILEGKYRKPSALRPDLPPEVEATIVRALSRDIEKRFPSAAAMRAELSAGQAELTPAPIHFASMADSEAIAAPGSPPLLDGTPIQLSPAAVAPRPSGKRAAKPGADPFAPPPEADAMPLLADPLDRSISFRPAHRSTPEELLPPPARPRPRTASSENMARPRRITPSPRGHTMAPDETAGAPAWRRWLLIAGAGLVLVTAGALAWNAFGPAGNAPLLQLGGGKKKITLVVDPKEASVQIDHVPATAGVLALETGSERPHKVNATAPGRITRRFAFTATPGMTLNVRLNHTLDAPSPADPPPLPAELAADYAENPRPVAEIDTAFVKLGRYAECLALVAEVVGEAKKATGRGRARDEEAGTCRLAISEGADVEPALSELQAAGEAYLAAAQKGQKGEVLVRLAGTFRAEYLAARTVWQVEELSRQGKDEGMKSSWHMRRVALAAQAWMRSRKLSPPAPQVVEEQRAKLDQAFTTFMSYVRLSPQSLAQTSGATDFVSAAEEVAALANGAGGRKASELAALDVTRKLLGAFDALVVE